MKKVLNVSLTLLAAAMLTACGGSGSKSESLTPAPEPTNPGVTEEVVEQPTDPVVDEQPVDEPTDPVVAEPVDNSSNISTLSDRTFLGTTDDLTKIMVDGQEVILVPAGMSAGSFMSISTGSGMHVNTCCGSLSYTRFGQVRDSEGNLFNLAQGTEFTADSDVPTTGVVSYTGHAINNWGQGTAALEVDFGNREITGTLTGTQDAFGAPIAVNATIDGAQFNGTAQSGAANADLQGAFFGPEAAELGAIFEGDGLSGAFGAKKD